MKAKGRADDRDAPELWDPGYRDYWARYQFSGFSPVFQPLPVPARLEPPAPWSASDRRRRSRIDWSALIDDPEVVSRQEGYERNATVLAMRDVGLSHKEIAVRIGVTCSRVSQIIIKAERQRRRPSPMEEYLRDEFGLGDVVAVRAAGRAAGTLGRLCTGDWRAP